MASPQNGESNEEGIYPEGFSPAELGAETFQLVARKGQLAEWLRLPLFHAAEEGNRRLVDKLIEAGASGKAGWRGPGGQTLLHAAAVGGNEGVLDSLIKAGAEPDVNVLTEPPDGFSALWVAIGKGHEAVARRLVALGADVNFKRAVHNNWTVLHWAIFHGHDQLVGDLILRGADVLARDDFEATALVLACEIGRVPVLQALFRCGADVNARNKRGWSLLLLATKLDQASSVDFFIEAGADIEQKDNEGQTPLANAAFYGCAKSSLALLRHGASVNAQDGRGRTPLFCACYLKCEGLEAVVDVLLKWGADETIADKNGRTPASTIMITRPDGEGCSQDEIDRVRLLLQRAPADRAWRRRGWVVMLRARVSTPRTEDAGCKVAKGDAGAMGGGDEVFLGVVDWLVGVGPNGVFREVVLFL